MSDNDQEMQIGDIYLKNEPRTVFTFDDSIKYLSSSSSSTLSSSKDELYFSFSSAGDDKQIIYNPENDIEIEINRIRNLIKEGYYLGCEQERKLLCNFRLRNYKYFKNRQCIEDEIEECANELGTLFEDIYKVLDENENQTMGEQTVTIENLTRFCNCTFCALLLSETHLNFLNNSELPVDSNSLEEYFKLIKPFLAELHVNDQYLPIADILSGILPRFDEFSLNKHQNLFFVLDRKLKFVNFSKKYKTPNKRLLSDESDESVNRPPSYSVDFDKPGTSGLSKKG